MLDVDYGHAQYSVASFANMDSMADDGLEEINKTVCRKKVATKKANIPRSTAYKTSKEYNERTSWI
ncbi:hypothetical protein BD560DRAFT_400546 [Blakeslea trispora]|nr:hypothetical protein BD560DRAFT_400546 [Blakeslea trispora]